MMAGGLDWSSFAPGTPIEGGFFAGIMRYVDGDYALIVAPKSSEATLVQKGVDSYTAGTQSLFDGLTNSNAMNHVSYQAAKHCLDYAGSGFTDWYLPARDELELCYRSLKPDSIQNTTGARPESGSHGQNANSVPAGSAYTSTVPWLTADAAFKIGGLQAFAASTVDYWSSTEDKQGFQAWTQSFRSGQQSVASKSQTRLVRPVRRVKI